MINDQLIACVIPCFRETNHILEVLRLVPDFVDSVYVIDDGCPDGTGDLVVRENKDGRVTVIFLEKNCGVGGATIAGYKQALKNNADIVVKIDGDGQMDPNYMMSIIQPIIDKTCDYTKGNRFFFLKEIMSMPKKRILGNVCLSLISKFSSGFWSISDPVNGYTAIHNTALRSLDLDSISKGYFFESDMLCKLYVEGGTVIDVPIPARYGAEKSGICIPKIIPPFIFLHAKRFFSRIFLIYFLKEFNFYSLNLLFGFIFSFFGLVFGFFNFYLSIVFQSFASAGTVMLSALPIFLGFICLMQFLVFDISNEPKQPLQNLKK